MSIFELIMLVCFGLAWPVNIYKTLTTESVEGKSVGFMYVIVIGYISGIIHKFLYSRDFVLVLYVINLIMVSADIILYHLKVRRLNTKKRSETI